MPWHTRSHLEALQHAAAEAHQLLTHRRHGPVHLRKAQLVALLVASLK